jgi:hypothetical protein
MAVLDDLTGHRRLRLRDGLWIAAEGVVYDEWDVDVHLIDRFEIPADWRRFRVVDFGFTNPTCVQWWAIDGDGRMFMYREIYKTGTIVEDHARQIRDLDEDRHLPTVCDHDAEDRATLKRHLRQETKAAKKSIKIGIEAVKKRLRPAGDGRPRLHIMRDSLVEVDDRLRERRLPTCTAEEFEEYVWPKGGGKEVPVDRNNHGCLIAGTIVTTDRGDVPIESLGPDDRVLTRAGYFPIAVHALTDPAARVLSVSLSNGMRLTGTADHPVFAPSRGWIPLDALRYGDMMSGAIESRGSVDARGAGQTSAATATPSNDFAPVRVLRVNPAGNAPVYNLAVAGPLHEYFANGVLVSNCDALRYAVMWVDGGDAHQQVGVPGVAGERIAHRPSEQIVGAQDFGLPAVF